MICNPMGRPAWVKPQGIEIAGNPRILIGRVFSEQEKFTRAEEIGILFQFRDYGRRNWRRRSHQQVQICKDGCDFAARAFKFATPFRDCLHAYIFPARMRRKVSGW